MRSYIHCRSLRSTPMARHVAGFWRPSVDFVGNRGEISRLPVVDPNNLLKMDVLAGNLGDFLDSLEFFMLLTLNKLIHSGFSGKAREQKDVKNEG